MSRSGERPGRRPGKAPRQGERWEGRSAYDRGRGRDERNGRYGDRRDDRGGDRGHGGGRRGRDDNEFRRGYGGDRRGGRDDRREYGYRDRDDRNRPGRYRESAGGDRQTGRRDRWDRDDRPRRYFDDREPGRRESGRGREDRVSRDRKARPFTREGYREREEARGLRARYGRAETKPEPAADAKDEVPPVPEGITPKDLDKEVRERLMTLPKGLANLIAVHLVAAERALTEEDPDRAYEHVKVARRFGSRVGVVREAAGIAAYRAGRYAEALNDLRAARRLMGSDDLLPLLADCERGLGRPERALELIRSVEPERIGRAVRIELAIVESGARRDLGQKEAAVVTLQRVPELRDTEQRPWSARLAFAYADALADAGKTEAAIEWFAKAMMFDEYGETDAAVRYAELTGTDVPSYEIEDIEEDFDDLEAGDDVRPPAPPARTDRAATEAQGDAADEKAAAPAGRDDAQHEPEHGPARRDAEAALAERAPQPDDDAEDKEPTGHEPEDAADESPAPEPGDAAVRPEPSVEPADTAARTDTVESGEAGDARSPEDAADAPTEPTAGRTESVAPAQLDDEPGLFEETDEPLDLDAEGPSEPGSGGDAAGQSPDASVNGTAKGTDDDVVPADAAAPAPAAEEAPAASVPVRNEA
ncbi:tetratricopeptide repeat protein [Thermopolyspora flexuosa]|uniref:Tetratricopeptide repeat protein n=1 Tax=Thermopolyspora flexuosa TaxID=103836 RepID=A0A543IXG2_9ACTN|nr:tetratricopeptide repeat protein [Thermopolyspora flexuosa]TQM75264.1 hypothetical protein FHX40_1969 [Thermopolyspora flexuosa]